MDCLFVDHIRDSPSVACAFRSCASRVARVKPRSNSKPFRYPDCQDSLDRNVTGNPVSSFKYSFNFFSYERLDEFGTVQILPSEMFSYEVCFEGRNLYRILGAGILRLLKKLSRLANLKFTFLL